MKKLSILLREFRILYLKNAKHSTIFILGIISGCLIVKAEDLIIHFSIPDSSVYQHQTSADIKEIDKNVKTISLLHEEELKSRDKVEENLVNVIKNQKIEFSKNLYTALSTFNDESILFNRRLDTLGYSLKEKDSMRVRYGSTVIRGVKEYLVNKM